MDGRTYGQMDKPSYRDARMDLKREQTGTRKGMNSSGVSLVLFALAWRVRVAYVEHDEHCSSLLPKHAVQIGFALCKTSGDAGLKIHQLINASFLTLESR